MPPTMKPKTPALPRTTPPSRPRTKPSTPIVQPVVIQSAETLVIDNGEESTFEKQDEAEGPEVETPPPTPKKLTLMQLETREREELLRRAELLLGPKTYKWAKCDETLNAPYGEC